MGNPKHSIQKLLNALTTHSTRFFVIVALIFGVMICFRMPPLFGNDEIVHFPRAFQIQEGHLWTEQLQDGNHGGNVPVQLKQFNDGYREQVQIPQTDNQNFIRLKQRFSSERLTDSKREPLPFTSAGVYSAWAYSPVAAGVFIARTLNLPLNWYVYLARLFSLATYIILVYFAIKYIPFGKIFLLAVALLPTALSQASTVGIDSVVNGSSWLIIALTLAVFSQKLKLNAKLLAVLAFLSLFLATTKQGYVPIALLPLLIPARLYPWSYKKVWLWRGLFGVGLLIVSMWYLSTTAPLAETMHNVQRPGLYVNGADQLHYVFQHSLKFMSMIFIQPFTIWAANIYAGVVGILTNKVIFLPTALVLLLFIMLALTAFHKERPHIAKQDRLFIVGSSVLAFLGSFVLINLALYLTFTQVGYDHVEGLQGRYFLPLLPLLGIILHVAMPNLFLKISDSLMSLIVYPTILVGLTVAVIAIH